MSREKKGVTALSALRAGFGTAFLSGQTSEVFKTSEVSRKGKGSVTQVGQLLESYKADLTKIPKPVTPN